MFYDKFEAKQFLTLLHSEWQKLHGRSECDRVQEVAQHLCVCF